MQRENVYDESLQNKVKCSAILNIEQLLIYKLVLHPLINMSN
jgi:hypothetical protein